MKTETQTAELTFDGVGINGPDEYRSRVATFVSSEDLTRAEVAAKYGPLFAAAPELLAACEYAREEQNKQGWISAECFDRLTNAIAKATSNAS